MKMVYAKKETKTFSSIIILKWFFIILVMWKNNKFEILEIHIYDYHQTLFAVRVTVNGLLLRPLAFCLI